MKKNFIILIVHCSLLIPSARDCFSQSITWQRLYNSPYGYNDDCKDLCLAANGNFYSVGLCQTGQGDYSYILKLNPFGDTIWTRINTFNFTTTCAESGDGGVVIVGDANYSKKYDSSGNTVWEKSYGGTGIRYHDIIKTSDGGFLACGEQRNFSGTSFHYDGYVTKLDFNGNILWDTIYPGYDKTLYSVIESISEGYVFTGRIQNLPTDTPKCLVMKIDYFGNIKWEKSLRVFGYNATGYIINRLNNGFAIVGSMYNVFIMKVDNDGNKYFEKIIKANVMENPYDFKILNNNRYAITIFRDTAKNIITDSIGNIIYEKTYPGYYSIFESILPLNNGDIIFGGTGRFFGFEVDEYIIRTDSMLNSPTIGIIKNNNQIPSEYALYQNYPNPFNSQTIIKFDVPLKSEIIIKIYDLLGREIRKITDGKYEAGSYQISYNPGNLSSGVYFVALFASGFKFTRKLVLVK